MNFKKKICSVALSLCMIASSLAIAPTSYAVSSEFKMYIGNETYDFRAGVPEKNLPNGVSFDKTSNTITLNNYNGSQIAVVRDDADTDVFTIKIQGNNTITASATSGMDGLSIAQGSGAVKIVGDDGATLNIDTTASLEARGINSKDHGLTISGGNYNIKSRSLDQDSYGIFAKNLIIDGTTNMKVEAERGEIGEEVAGGPSIKGISIDNSGELNISTSGKVEVNVAHMTNIKADTSTAAILGISAQKVNISGKGTVSVNAKYNQAMDYKPTANGHNSFHDGKIDEEAWKTKQVEYSPKAPPEFITQALPDGNTKDEYDVLIDLKVNGSILKDLQLVNSNLPSVVKARIAANQIGIRGYFTEAKTYNFTVEISNEAGKSSKAYTINVVKPTVYKLTVENGTGSGDYKVGEKVDISPNDPPAGKIFEQWMGGVQFTNPTMKNQTITMPDKDINVKAIFIDKPSNPTTVKSISISAPSVFTVKGATQDLKVTFDPTDAINKSIKSWTSSNNGVATVKNGIVTAVSNGTATITAVVEDSDVTTSTQVEVKIPGSSSGSGSSGGSGGGGGGGSSSTPKKTTDAKTTDKTTTTEQKSTTQKPKENAKKFNDVQPNSWYAKSVDFVVSNNLMVGVSKDNFAPQSYTNRAMIVTILHRLASTPKVDTKNKFNDVANGKYYTNAVLWASEKNIVSGFGDGTFKPNEQLSREQLITILYNYTKSVGKKVDTKAQLNMFKDSKNISAYALKPMNWAVENGIITGISEDTISPKTGVTRAQMAVILEKYTKLLEK